MVKTDCLFQGKHMTGKIVLIDFGHAEIVKSDEKIALLIIVVPVLINIEFNVTLELNKLLFDIYKDAKFVKQPI